jgi:hypothetical protein
MSRIVQTIVNSDRTRRVEIYEAADGTFGFTHWKWGAPEQAWFTVGPAGSRCDSAETALREAKSRVAWASDGVLVESRPLSLQQAKVLVQARLEMFQDEPVGLGVFLFGGKRRADCRERTVHGQPNLR